MHSPNQFLKHQITLDALPDLCSHSGDQAQFKSELPL